MADEMDFSAAAEKIQEMFGSDDGRQQIRDIISMFGGGQDSEEQDTDKTSCNNNFGMNIDPENIEMMMKIQQIMSVMNSAEVTRQTSFLKSLSPLLKPEKREKINNAVKFLSIGKAIEAFKKM